MSSIYFVLLGFVLFYIGNNTNSKYSFIGGMFILMAFISIFVSIILAINGM